MHLSRRSRIKILSTESTSDCSVASNGYAHYELSELLYIGESVVRIRSPSSVALSSIFHTDDSVSV